MSIEFTKLDWHKVDGLIPTIIQDSETRQVLMLGYVNQEALQKTYATGKVTFYSRSKQRLWTKGETSGNELHLVSMHHDCDSDSLLMLVKPTGPCCHLNHPSCFANDASSTLGILAKLEAIIQQRYADRSAESYIANLFDAGTYRIAQKVGEEGVEVALASVSGCKENTINETADLFFHLLILLKQSNIKLVEVLTELERRANR